MTTKARKRRGYWTSRTGLHRRGAGNRGGRGNAGGIKKGSANKLKYIINREKNKGFINQNPKIIKAITLRTISSFPEKEIDITKKGYDKVLGTGKLTSNKSIKAHAFTEIAKKKIENAGGKAIVI